MPVVSPKHHFPPVGIYGDSRCCRRIIFVPKKAMEKDEKRGRARAQLVCAVALVALGAGLLIAGFVVSPIGEIHGSVLVSFGEILTFAGAVFGIDYRYKES